MQMKLLSQEGSQLLDFLVEDGHVIEEGVPGARRFYVLIFVCETPALRAGAGPLLTLSALDPRFRQKLFALLPLWRYVSRFRRQRRRCISRSGFDFSIGQVRWLRGISGVVLFVHCQGRLIGRVAGLAWRFRRIIERAHRRVFGFAFKRLGFSAMPGRILINGRRSSP
ncbi:hypothetical protein ATB98_16640 [Sinorhizobium saheli]|uniref:Uncharacterized protein n=1 Tax=Sinorhizobium saheli TaxID=36856 RepID=A0A178YSV0_SINSA|nr:hypothetical protein ATB98_16640 [Sinorhizobium saheli]